MVAASSASWWLTEVAAGRSEKCAMADSGTIAVTDELTTLPVDASRSDRLAEVPLPPVLLPVPVLPVLPVLPPAVLLVVPLDAETVAVEPPLPVLPVVAPSPARTSA